jgi:CelD/BcsL family acetyltransferase involved in cellulose biosynthesis
MLVVHEINHCNDLAGFAEQWNALAAQTPEASFFQTFDWFDAYWSHFGAAGRLRVLVVESGRRIVGILPLVVRKRPRFPALRVLGYPLDDWGSFYGPIGPDPSLTLAAGLDHIGRTPRDWDAIEMAWIDALGTDQGRTRQALEAAHLAVLAEPRATSALVDLSPHGDWAGYWGSRSSHWRTNVRRSEKKLSAQGPLRFVRHRPARARAGQADPRWDLYETCERLAEASWQGASQTGTTLSHAAIRPFLHTCHARAAEAAALDMNLLYVGGRAVAFNYAYHFGGRVFGLRTGYDRCPELAGAGSVLQARMIEDSFQRGDRRYDLGPDYLACKRHWLTETRTAWRYTHFAPGAPLAQLMRARRTAKRWLAAGA